MQQENGRAIAEADDVMANSDREMKVIRMYVVDTHMTGFARACRQRWRGQGRRQWARRKENVKWEERGERLENTHVNTW